MYGQATLLLLSTLTQLSHSALVPGSTRHDRWLLEKSVRRARGTTADSRGSSRARLSSVGTRHGGSGVCALLCCAVVVGSAVSFTAAHASSPFGLPMLARAVRRRADTVLCPSLSPPSRSFPLSLLRRLLMSAAWESVAMRHAASASALLAVAAARLLFRIILAREGGGTFEGEVRVDTGIGREGVCIRVCVCVCVCVRASLPESTLVVTAVHSHSPF